MIGEHYVSLNSHLECEWVLNVDSERTIYGSVFKRADKLFFISTESLILAQDERWRRA